MDISSFYYLPKNNQVANKEKIIFPSNFKKTNDKGEVTNLSEVPLDIKEIKTFSLNTSLNFLNSNFMQPKAEVKVRTYINDSSPSKEIVSQPFMSPIYENPIIYSDNSRHINSNNNFQNNSILSSLELKVEEYNAVCKFRFSEISEDEFEAEIIQRKKEISRTNKLPSHKNKNWNCDLTFSSKKKELRNTKAKDIAAENQEDFNASILFQDAKFKSEKRKKYKRTKAKERITNNCIEEKIFFSNSDKVTRCTCGRSKCIKKYCECYANGERCNKDLCKCVDCQNLNVNNSKVAIPINESDKENFDQINLNGDCLLTKKRHQKEKKNLATFCNCTKSKCNKHYCECFKYDKTCNSLCRCLRCNNKEKEKNVYDDNITKQSFERLSISIINNNLTVSKIIENMEIPIISRKNKRKGEKAVFRLNECKSPAKKFRTPLFTTTCESTVSKKISNLENIVQKMSSNEATKVRRKIEMKKFSNQNFYDLKTKQNQNVNEC